MVEFKGPNPGMSMSRSAASLARECLPARVGGLR